MGGLHEGHLALVRLARRLAGPEGKVMVSIFLNPRQFDREEDYNSYPRTPQADAETLEKLKSVDYLLMPKEIYPPNWQRRHTVPDRLNGCLCGFYRGASHFQGVTDAVDRIFTLSEPGLSVFGEKDYQQLLIIQNMVKELGMRIKIHPHPVVREEDGLAYSSRNTLLTPTERALAPAIYRTMREMAKMDWGEDPSAWGRKTLSDKGFRVEYLELRNSQDLRPVPAPPGRIFCAAYLGSTRLIDNLKVEGSEAG